MLRMFLKEHCGKLGINYGLAGGVIAGLVHFRPLRAYSLVISVCLIAETGRIIHTGFPLVTELVPSNLIRRSRFVVGDGLSAEFERWSRELERVQTKGIWGGLPGLELFGRRRSGGRGGRRERLGRPQWGARFRSARRRGE